MFFCHKLWPKQTFEFGSPYYEIWPTELDNQSTYINWLREIA